MNTNRKILIALFLFAGMESSFADPAWARHDVDNRQHNKQSQEMRRQEIRNQNKNYNSSASPESASRGNAKMSAEERRALRRQINDASRSLYYR